METQPKERTMWDELIARIEEEDAKQRRWYQLKLRTQRRVRKVINVKRWL
jgi:hypothetical protein